MKVVMSIAGSDSSGEDWDALLQRNYWIYRRAV
jgi:hypothetical protein